MQTDRGAGATSRRDAQLSARPVAGSHGGRQTRAFVATVQQPWRWRPGVVSDRPSMYSLRHGVNLSRRACRTFLLVALCVLATSAVSPVSADSSPVLTYPRPDLEPMPKSTHGAYDGVQFGPMGPVVVNHEASTPSTDDHTADHHAKEVQRYPVATVEFSRVETPFIIGLWIFSASLAKIGFHMAPKFSKMFPESCLLIVVGLVIGALLFHTTDSVHMSPLTPDTFFLYMLPPIILDAGYFMPNRLFFDHLGTILLFAVIGTVWNTITIGTSLWAVGQTGLFAVNTPLLDMFLFSALISAVDPVAVLAVFEEIHVNEVLYILVFGESLLNDAVTVVLYHMFEAYSEMGVENILYTDLLSGFANFWVVALGGVFIGVIWGFATGFVTRFTHHTRVIEPIFIFVMAYLAYLNAEIFHMSGILAITFCGITMKNYVEQNISHKSHTTVKYAMKMLSGSSETIIFMFLGVCTINSAHDWNTFFVLLTIAFCSFYRIIGVIILTAIANHFRLHQLNKVEKFVMCYGGLRGAVAFALVLLIDPKHVPLQPMFVTTTIAVIYFTVFFQGITIKPLVKILNVKRAEKRKPTMNERIHERFMDHTMAGIEEILGQHGNYHVRDKFKRFDNKFIRPYLLRHHQSAEPKILETYSKLAMRDAMEYMRRNASTIGNISGTESMSAIFRNYTAGNLNGRCAHPIITCFSQLDSSTWNIDMQELEYNPSKKDLTDAKIHHLLAEELCKPYRRHRRLSYSRHAVNDRDLSNPVNYRMHFNIRRFVGEKRHHSHHKRHSKKLLKAEGKQNHVSFPEFQQNGTAKQFTHDYINQVLQQDADENDPKSSRDDWDSPITFTAKSSLGLDLVRVTTPTATESVLPWKRGDEAEGSTPLQQSEFPAWASNKEYLAYNSPSATFLGGIENTRSSVIGLFRRESTGSVHLSSVETSPQHEARRDSIGPNTVIIIEDGVVADPLGVLQRSGSTVVAAAVPATGTVPQAVPTTPNQWRQSATARRGSMLELSGSIRDTIPEESGASGVRERRYSERLTVKPAPKCTPRPQVRRQQTRGIALLSSTSPSTTSSSEEDDEDVGFLKKAGL